MQKNKHVNGEDVTVSMPYYAVNDALDSVGVMGNHTGTNELVHYMCDTYCRSYSEDTASCFCIAFAMVYGVEEGKPRQLEIRVCLSVLMARLTFFVHLEHVKDLVI
jgi:hypothetical protein